MSIRIRTVNGLMVALCAAETEAEQGDVYLDDPQHYALAAKFAKDWHGQMVDWQYPKQWLVMEGQLKREGDEAMSDGWDDPIVGHSASTAGKSSEQLAQAQQNAAMDCGHARRFRRMICDPADEMLGGHAHPEPKCFRCSECERIDGVYSERNRVVAYLSHLYPASLERHPDEDGAWDDEWRWIVFIDLPEGQASWHLHDSHLSLFDHLKLGVGRKWDGHSTEEKYRRLESAQGSERIVFLNQYRLAAEQEVDMLEEQLRAADAVLEAMKPNSLCPHDEEPDYCVCCEADRNRRTAVAARAYLALRHQREEIPYGQ